MVKCIHNYLNLGEMMTTQELKIAPKNIRMKFCSHVGMNYTNNFADLFSFQLIGRDGVAYAGVDFESGQVERIYYIPQLNNRKLAIIRLAKIHYNKARK